MTKMKFLLATLVISGIVAIFLTNQKPHQTIPEEPLHTMHGQHAEQSGVMSLDVKYVDGTLHLLMGKEENGQQDIWYQSSSDQGVTWSEAVNVTLNSDVAAKFKRGNDARLAVQGDNIVAVWMTKVEGAPFGAGPMMAMRSDDRGQSWQLATMPADWEGAHGFFAMDGNDKGINLVWLDSREQKVKGSQGLRFSQTRDGGLNWSSNLTLDDLTCACCWNTVSFDDDGLFYVLYRDKQPSDMAIGRVDPELNWQRLSSVGEFNWDFEGCPHIGAGLAIDSKIHRFHATVSTGQPDNVGLYYLNSDDKGQGWSPPIKLGNNGALHSDIVVSSDGTVVVVWDQLSENGLQMFYAKSDDDGQTWSKPSSLSKIELSASHPRVVATKHKTLIFWTESDHYNNSHMKIMELPFHD
jgi:hypothetical protein